MTCPLRCHPWAPGTAQTSRSEPGCCWGRPEWAGARPRGVQGAGFWLLSGPSPRSLLLPRRVPAERPWARLRVRVYRAEGLPALRPGLLGGLARALHDQRVPVDPYVRVSFLGQQVGHSCPRSAEAQGRTPG